MQVLKIKKKKKKQHQLQTKHLQHDISLAALS